MSYFSDYPNEPIGGGNPYYRCCACGVSDPQINGALENHALDCSWVEGKRRTLGVIPSFDGDHWFLSNFYPSPVEYEDQRYPTAEHAFQAAKTEDRGQRAAIRVLSSPGKAKQAGRALALRPGWERLKFDVMLDVVCNKFEASERLSGLLLATGEVYLLEGNLWHDNIWGHCKCLRCEASGLQGENRLGKILMLVRSQLRRDERKRR